MSDNGFIGNLDCGKENIDPKDSFVSKCVTVITLIAIVVFIATWN